MAIPSGAGTEVLKVAYQSQMTNSDINLVTAGNYDIITVLSIIFCERDGNNEEMIMYIDAARNDIGGNSGQNIYMMNRTKISGRSVFVWNDKFTIYGGDILKASTQTASSIGVTVSYIVQDWSQKGKTMSGIINQVGSESGIIGLRGLNINHADGDDIHLKIE